MPTPDECTSIDCTLIGCDYCAICSHAVYNGSGIDKNGKEWSWEFYPYYGRSAGTLFVGKRGEPLANQPVSERHPAWGLFETWMEENKKRMEKNG